MMQKVIQVGNSAAITLPKKFLEGANISTGDSVNVDIDEATKVMVVSSDKYPFLGMSPDISIWTKKFIEKNRKALQELANK